MEYEIEKRKAPGRDEVAVLGAPFEEGKPEGEELGRRRQKLGRREGKLKHLQIGERYWQSDEKDWYGSEKRRKP
ncbi:hypothetical protein ES707_13253 [subsurface metagenome]